MTKNLKMYEIIVVSVQYNLLKTPLVMFVSGILLYKINDIKVRQQSKLIKKIEIVLIKWSGLKLTNNYDYQHTHSFPYKSFWSQYYKIQSFDLFFKVLGFMGIFNTQSILDRGEIEISWIIPKKGKELEILTSSNNHIWVCVCYFYKQEQFFP